MVGQRSKEVRLSLGLSQAQVAGEELSRSYIGAVESGRVNPSLDKLKLIAERLGKPVSCFVPDEQEILSDRLETMLSQARALLGVKEWSQAKDLFDECRQAYSQEVRPSVRALYLEVRAELELHGSGVLKAVDSYKAAAQAYEAAHLPASAWECLYTAAMQLYIANHVSYASFVATEALETIEPDEGLVDELAKTHYLVGCCYAVLGNSTGASEHFSQAEEASSKITETSIKALIGKASCFGRQNDWGVALKHAQKAASLASKSQLNWLKAEALIGAAVCLVNMQNVTRAGNLLSELSHIPQLTSDIKRKAYREVILALSELKLTEASLPYEKELQRLMDEPGEVEEWEQLKDSWAITKCSLLRNPAEVMKVVSLFSQSFIRLARYRDAADVLSFGAELLEQQGRPEEALELMKAACDLYKGRPQ